MERMQSQQEEEEEDEVVIHLTSKNPQVNSCFHQAYCSATWGRSYKEFSSLLQNWPSPTVKWDVDTSSFIPVYSQCQLRKPISSSRLFPLYVPFHNKHFNVFQAAEWFGIYHFRVPSYILILKRWEIAYIVYAENLNDSEIWELNPELKTAFAKFKVLEFMLIFFNSNEFLTWKAKQQAAANGERQGRGTRCEIFLAVFNIFKWHNIAFEEKNLNLFAFNLQVQWLCFFWPW